MPVMTMVQALQNALDVKLADDPSVLCFGEDVGVEGGVFRVTEHLQKKHGVKRVFDTPLAESSIVGACIGMSVMGLRPVAEMQFDGFVYPAMNQIITHVARYRYRTRGQRNVPCVIRFPYGGGVKALELHSEAMEAMYAHIPGLKVVIPSTPYDAKGLMIAAIEDNDPVIFQEPKRLYRAMKQEVPDGLYRIPIGKAKVEREGRDMTVISWGAMMHVCRKALESIEKDHISVELVDLRTIYPLDWDTIVGSVKKTGRVLIVQEGPKSFGVAAELIALINEKCFEYLEAPPMRLCGNDTIPPLPRSEDLYCPTPERVHYYCRKLADYQI
ncbi:MAG: alpha-ketoacid dehydrogenase subunit beta [bacterium]|nr:alpha-ketoacid dehydrogenase subunit beta [bacterium]